MNLKELFKPVIERSKIAVIEGIQIQTTQSK